MLKTFDSYLTDICDYFDETMNVTIKRSNYNVLYLIFKSLAKGFELITSIAESLRNKFDPENCDSADINSIALIAGTEKIAGTNTGLEIVITNTTTDSSVILKAGTYQYVYSDDYTFSFTVNEDVEIEAEGSVSYFTFIDDTGEVVVTAQDSITVKREDEADINTALVFSCLDNADLLGTKEETDYEFRKRILTTTNRQDLVSELETAIKNLGYVYDCKIVFNSYSTDITEGSVTIPPYTMAIFVKGDLRDEIASIVASKGIYPTLSASDTDSLSGVTLYYENDVFTDTGYAVNILEFGSKEYFITIKLKYDSSIISESDLRTAVKTSLSTYMKPTTWNKTITEYEFYSLIKELNLSSVTVLNIDLYNSNNEAVEYLEATKDVYLTLNSSIVIEAIDTSGD